MRHAGDAARGVLVTCPKDPRKAPAAAALVEAFRAEGFEPEGYTLYAYAAVQLVAAAANEAGTNDPMIVAQSIRGDGPWDTALGSLSYDSKGDLSEAAYVMCQWSKSGDGYITAELK